MKVEPPSASPKLSPLTLPLPKSVATFSNCAEPEITPPLRFAVKVSSVKIKSTYSVSPTAKLVCEEISTVPPAEPRSTCDEPENTLSPFTSKKFPSI